MPATRSFRRLPAVCLAAALLFAGLAAPAGAIWMAGRGSDDTGLVYLAVVNDSETGERIELNCTPAGQAFLALSWNAAATALPGEGVLTLRFLVDGSRRFAAPARFRPLDRGWGAAELDTPEVLGPLTEALSIGSGVFEVEIVQRGTVLVQSLFDMEAAPASIGRYRSYCHM